MKKYKTIQNGKESVDYFINAGFDRDAILKQIPCWIIFTSEQREQLIKYLNKEWLKLYLQQP